MMHLLALLVAIGGALPLVEAFSSSIQSYTSHKAIQQFNKVATPRNTAALHASKTYTPIFDFTLADSAIKDKSAASFERIDDAIMGGISQSSLRDIPNQPYASWSGVCRTDGGGFCGMRTLPFIEPLQAENQEGIYFDSKLVSDAEADRRIWKMTVRSDSSRGEQVYQSEYDLQQAINEANKSSKDGKLVLERTTEGTVIKKDQPQENKDEWARVKIPFDSFRLVRGPRLVPDSPPINITGGIYQIGMTMSKFKMAENTTQLDNFRDGYFDMHIQRIGFYNDNKDEAAAAAASVQEEKTATVPITLSKDEASKKRPLLLKVLLPMAKIFFSETANRRRSAMRILREERNLSRFQAIKFGMKWRRGSRGIVSSICKTLSILAIDAFRAVIKNVLRVAILYPLRAVGYVVKKIKLLLGMKVKPSLRE